MGFRRFTRPVFCFFVFALGAGTFGALAGAAEPATSADRPEAFGREVEALRRLLGVAGLQVSVVRDGQVVLERAYGHADLEAGVPMTTDHLIEIASVTKSLTAVVFMQLVEEGKVSLDDRVVKYPFHRWFYPTRITPEVRLRHVLSHTSQGPPGEVYCYEGNRFGFVLGAFGTTPEAYGEAVARRLFRPLGMDRTLPQPGVVLSDSLRALLAKPYGGFDPATGRPTSVANPPVPRDYFPSSGFFSNVKDLSRYAIALQKHALISGRSYEVMESPGSGRDGKPRPYGIGWFSQEFAGARLVWHYGYGNGSSALLLRVPDREVTLIALANSENLSESTRLGYGNVLDAPLAVAFLKHFVFAKETAGEGPSFDGDLPAIRAALTALDASKPHPIDAEELFAQAVVRELMWGPNRDSDKARGLLRILLELKPKRLLDSGLTGLEVLSRYDDPALNPTTERLALALTPPGPVHPAALFYASRFFEKTGRPDEALRLLERLADSDFEDDQLTLDACVALGERLASRDPKRARAYYWRAVRIGWQSPGYPRGKVDRAIEALNALDRPALSR